jgi:hypothetical protein
MRNSTRPRKGCCCRSGFVLFTATLGEEKLQRTVSRQEFERFVGRRRLDDMVASFGEDVRGIHADEGHVVDDER